MNRFRKIIIAGMSAALLLLTAAGCGNDDPKVESVEFSAGSATTVIVGDAATVVTGDVSFTATGGWNSRIYNADAGYNFSSTSTSPDWVVILPFEGGEGTFMPHFHFTPNESTAARYAVVVVASASNEIAIKVKQSGKASSEGDTPAVNPDSAQ